MGVPTRSHGGVQDLMLTPTRGLGSISRFERQRRDLKVTSPRGLVGGTKTSRSSTTRSRGGDQDLTWGGPRLHDHPPMTWRVDLQNSRGGHETSCSPPHEVSWGGSRPHVDRACGHGHPHETSRVAFLNSRPRSLQPLPGDPQVSGKSRPRACFGGAPCRRKQRPNGSSSFPGVLQCGRHELIALRP